VSYKADPARDAKAFDILQNMPAEVAQAFFWNFKSREERREAILAWHAHKIINEKARELVISTDSFYL
jgi:hypothetical protein